MTWHALPHLCPLPRYDCPGGDKEEDFVRSLCDAYRAKTGKDSPLCPAKPTKA
jgi:hypothetical protein